MTRLFVVTLNADNAQKFYCGKNFVSVKRYGKICINIILLLIIKIHNTKFQLTTV